MHFRAAGTEPWHGEAQLSNTIFALSFYLLELSLTRYYLVMTRTIAEMVHLRDMGRFPTSVYLGATANILLSIWLTRIVFTWCEGSVVYLFPWALLLPVVNVLPVLLLRKLEAPELPYPQISQMSFFRDQHRFSSWVYAVAASNMFFWIVFSWWVLTLSTSFIWFIFLELFAATITFVPLWRRYHPSFQDDLAC